MRDSLIQQQESLLNTYRCLFDTDTHVVPGGCVDGMPAEQADSDTAPTPEAQSWPTTDQTFGDWEYLAPDDDGTATAIREVRGSRQHEALYVQCHFGSSGWKLWFMAYFDNHWPGAWNDENPITATWHIGATERSGEQSGWTHVDRGIFRSHYVYAPNPREMAGELARTSRGTFSATFRQRNQPDYAPHSQDYSLNGAMDAITPVLAYCDSKLGG